MTCDEVNVLPVLTNQEAITLVAGEWMRHGPCTWASAPDLDDIADGDMRALCRECPVRVHCLAYGLLVDARHYIYGGYDYAERRRFDNGQRYSVCSEPTCGRGFIWNRVGNTQPPGVCETCNSTERLATAYTYGGTT